MKILMTLSLVLLIAPLAAAAAEKPKAKAKASPTATPTPGEWKKQLVASLTLTQAAFDNWKQGGSNFVSWQAGLTGKFERDNDSVNWVNSVKMEYGLTYLGGQETRKSADNLELESVHSWKTWPMVFPFVSASAKTQFDAGFDYTQDPSPRTSSFLDPGYFTQSAGLKFVPDPIFNTRLGLALRETLASSHAALYGVDPAVGVLLQVGLSSVSELDWKITETSSLTSKFELFWNGKALDRTVMQWDNLLSLGLNKVLSVNVELDLRMDPAAYPYWQVKETLGVGLAWTLL